MFKLFKNEKGMALPTVIILMAVLIVLSASAYFVTMSQLKMNQQYAGSVDALHYAEAGINQYLWHLNKTDSEAIATGVEHPFGTGFFMLHTEGDINNGYLTVRSTGYHKDNPAQTRTLEVMLSKKNFTQYVWLTDSEGDAYSATINTWNGPFHTNGDLRILGKPTFNGPVSYSGKIVEGSGGATPNYNMGGPKEIDKIVFPNSNSELKARAETGGHYYNGMTAIYLKGDTYDVRTYNSKYGWMYNGKTYSELGISFGSDAANAKPTGVASLTLPENGVIYVDGASTAQWKRGTGDLYISGTVNGRLTIAAANNIYVTGYDPTDWRVPSYRKNGNPKYLPRGALTEGIKYTIETKNTSIFGLISNNNIEILDKYWPGHSAKNDGKDVLQRWSASGDAKESDVGPLNLYLHGAYMALRGTIKYNYGLGIMKEDVFMFGSMIQKTRGAFASVNSSSGDKLNGYGREFEYDPKLYYQTPPFFIEPVEAGWEVNTWREVSQPVAQLN